MEAKFQHPQLLSKSTFPRDPVVPSQEVRLDPPNLHNSASNHLLRSSEKVLGSLRFDLHHPQYLSHASTFMGSLSTLLPRCPAVVFHGVQRQTVSVPSFPSFTDGHRKRPLASLASSSARWRLDIRHITSARPDDTEREATGRIGRWNGRVVAR